MKKINTESLKTSTMSILTNYGGQKPSKGGQKKTFFTTFSSYSLLGYNSFRIILGTLCILLFILTLSNESFAQVQNVRILPPAQINRAALLATGGAVRHNIRGINGLSVTFYAVNGDDYGGDFAEAKGVPILTTQGNFLNSMPAQNITNPQFNRTGMRFTAGDAYIRKVTYESKNTLFGHHNGGNTKTREHFTGTVSGGTIVTRGGIPYSPNCLPIWGPLTVTGGGIGKNLVKLSGKYEANISYNNCGFFISANSNAGTSITKAEGRFTRYPALGSSSHQPYHITVEIARDFGDAPASYQGSNPAAHFVRRDNPLFLGGSIGDFETNYAGGGTASGDTGENGISFPTLIKGRKYTRTINLKNTSGNNAFLSMWIDYQDNGTWNNTTERILSDKAIANNATSVTVTFTVPANAVAGTTFARLRLCDGSGDCNAVNGSARGGEVEDFQVTIACPSLAAPLSGGNKSYCVGETIPALTASVGAGQTVDWYSAASGGTLLRNNNTSYRPTGPGTYYAEREELATGCKSATRRAIVLTRNTLPAAPTASVTVQPTCNPITGTIVVTAPAPATNVTYTLRGTNPVVADVTQRSATFAKLKPGVYSLITTNTTTGCASPAITLTVDEIPAGVCGAEKDICDPTNPEFTDKDGDGVGDVCDLDDDNDGILDTDENNCKVGFIDDFGTGTTRVSTPYINSANYTFAATGITADGSYTIARAARPDAGDYPDWSTDPDHTPGDTNGRMLIVNADFFPGEFYRREVSNIISGIEMQFNFWARNVIFTSKILRPNIKINLEDSAGNVVYTSTTGDLLESQGWRNFSGSIFATDTSYTLVLINTDVGGMGNDFALDDIEFYQSYCDTDNDGIPDDQDSDSDNDGCPDALEGDGGFLYADLLNDTLTGGVDSVGVPLVAAGGQADVSSTNPNLQSRECLCHPLNPKFTDKDGDGVGDVCDLDDDNDGILDSIEFCTKQNLVFSNITQLVGTGTVNSLQEGDIYLLPDVGMQNGISFDATYEVITVDFNGGGSPLISSSTSISYTTTDAIQDDYVIIKITFIESGTATAGSPTGTPIDLNDFTFSLKDIESQFNSNLSEIGGVGNAQTSDNMPITYDNLSYPAGASTQVTVGDFINDGNEPNFTLIVTDPTFAGDPTDWVDETTTATNVGRTEFEYNSLSSIEVLVGLTGSEGMVSRNEFLSASFCDIKDSDGDGTPNYLDLDSDNDGCPDALEGDGGFLYADLLNDTLTGGVDTDGVPLVAAGGQADVSSTNPNLQSRECLCHPLNPEFTDNDGDGIGDVCDLDDDNDGLLDTLECPSDLQIATHTGLTDGVGPFTASLTSNGQTATITAIASDGASFVTRSESAYFSFYEDLSGTFTYTTDLPLMEVQIVISGLQFRNIVGNFTATLGDGTVLSDMLITIESTLGIFTTNNLSEGPLELTTGAEGLNYIYNPSTIIIQGEARLTFPVLTGEYLKSKGGLTSLSFAVEDGVNTGPNANFQLAGSICTDSDGDGTPNYLDLDSDNDGCPDALEGDGGFVYSDLETDNSFGNVVDTSGVPTAAGAGQGDVSSTDAGVQSDECDACNVSSTLFSDTDSDGIGDFCDLDDDNDGLLDVEECPLPSEPSGDSILWSSNNFIPGGYTDELPSFLSGVNNGTLASGFSSWTNLSLYGGTQVTFVTGGVDQPSYELALLENDYLEFTFRTNTGFNAALSDFIYRVAVDNVSGQEIQTDFLYTVAISSDNFSSNSTVLIEDSEYSLSAGTPVGSPTFTSSNRIRLESRKVNFPIYRLEESANYTVRIYLYDEGSTTIPDEQVMLDDFGFLALSGTCEDSDGDGTPNYLDLDSDNDGCPDALEGDGGFVYSDLEIDNSLGNVVDTSGVPTAAGAGQADVSSTDAGVIGQACVTPDTVITAIPECPTCPVAACVIGDDLPIGEGETTYTYCSEPVGYTAEPDSSGCVIYIGDGSNDSEASSCIVACKNGICDTTYVIIPKPITPDTVVVTPDCSTCPVTVCVTGDDLPTGEGETTYTYCIEPVGYTAEPDDNGCVTYTGDGSNDSEASSCIVACKNGICDTTYVIIPKPITPDTVVVTPACPTCPVTACVTGDDLPLGEGEITYTYCIEPIGYTAEPDDNGCVTYTGDGSNTSEASSCIIACKNGICDTTYVIIPKPITPDTVVVTPACPTCPVTACVTGDDLPTGEGEITYTYCSEPIGYTAEPDDNGCVTYTGDGSNEIEASSCIVACKNGICDTTYVIIPKPITPDTVITVIPACPTCPVTACVIGDDLPTGEGEITYTYCSEPVGYTAEPDGNGCVTYTGDGSNTSEANSCIIACKNGICDTTYVIIPKPITPDTVAVTPECSTCPVTACVVGDDLPTGEGEITYTYCSEPIGYTAEPDGNGCVTYTGDGSNTSEASSCIIACKNGICDTTYVIIPKPITPDTVITAIPGCPTCPVKACVIGDDLPTGEGEITYTYCSEPIGYTAEPDGNGCVTYTGDGSNTSEANSCIVACKNGICDTTYVIIPVPSNSDTIIVTPECSTCPVTVCAKEDDLPIGEEETTYTYCIEPMGYTAEPDGNGCVTYTGEEGNEIESNSCIVACKNGICDTTYVIILKPITPDTVITAIPACPTCPVTACVIGDDLPTGEGEITYTYCSEPIGYTAEPDGNGCVTYTGDGSNTSEANSCIVACKNGICDTTYVIIPKPITPDTVAVTPECSTCPVTACVVGDDLPTGEGEITYTYCSEPIGYTAEPDGNGCVTYTGDGSNTSEASSCIIACKNGICDTTYVIILISLSNKGPIADDEAVSTSEDTPIIIPVTLGDIDPDGKIDSTTVALVNRPSNGEVLIDPVTGDITYTPNPNFLGMDTLTYEVCDNGTPVLCDTAQVIITVGSECVRISASVFLEGPFESGSMHTKLNDLGYLPGQDPATFFGTEEPAGQPYSALPWNYLGTEGEEMNYTLLGDPKAGYAPTVVDWVLISLRTGVGSETTVCERAGLLHSDGHIEFLEEYLCCEVDMGGSYYVVIEHRNHLIVMSHEPVQVNSDNTITYDFRTQQSFRALLGFGQKEVSPGVFAMLAGNGEQMNSSSSDTDVNVGDKDTWLNRNGDHSSYYFQDFDLNGDTNVQDKNIWLKNNGKFSDVPKN